MVEIGAELIHLYYLEKVCHDLSLGLLYLYCN